MNRIHAKICSIVAILSLLIVHGFAQDKPLNPSHDAGSRSASKLKDGRSTSAANVREVVEAYVAAALAGRVADAATLAVPGAKPGFRKTIEEFREALNVPSLEFTSFLLSQEEDAALAISEQAKLTEPNPDGQDTGRLVFSLSRSDGKWLIGDIDFESEADAAKETGSHEDLAMCEALLLRLDAPQPERPSAAPDDRLADATPQVRQPSAAPQRASLRENYQQLERQAARLAEQYAALPTKATRTPGDAEALKQQLADVVKLAFAARQQLQQAELAQLRQRLARIEQQIVARERIKDAIIDRRIEELLNPDLRWDGNRETTHRSSASANVTQSQAVHAVTQTGDCTPADSKAIGQILFGAPLGARVTLRPDRAGATTVELPARVNIFKSSSDGPMPFRLSNIPAHAGLELSGTIELTPISAHIRAFLQRFVLPIEFHEQDVDNASSGNLVTKVVYLPKSEHQEFALAGMKMITSTRLNAGFNPIEEAERRGYVLATLRLGNRIPDDAESSEAKLQPEPAGHERASSATDSTLEEIR